MIRKLFAEATSSRTQSPTSKVKNTGKNLSRPSSPTIQIEVDFETKKSPSLKKNRVSDEKSTKSNASRRSPKNNNKTVASRKKKKTDSLKWKEDDTSVRSETRKKKSKKKKKKQDVGDDESVHTTRSSHSIKKKKKKKYHECDTESVGSIRSAHSKQSCKKHGKKKSKRSSEDRSRGSHDPVVADEWSLASDKDLRRINLLEEENTALFEETITIRRQLNDAETLLRELSRQNPHSNSDAMRELEKAQRESKELKIELEEYEDAVIEKDELIKKLTEAVDAQLDKVEMLEAKMMRAEDEFCAMEEEMKDMEDVIEELRSKDKYELSLDTNSSSRLGREITSFNLTKELEEREKKIKEKEQDLRKQEDDLREREAWIKEQNDELRKERSRQENKPRPFGSDIESDDENSCTNEGESSGIGKLEARILALEAENNDLWHENETLRHRDVGGDRDASSLKLLEDQISEIEADFQRKMLEIQAENEDLLEENSSLRQKHAERASTDQQIDRRRDEELKLLKDDFEKSVADISIENKILRQELDDLKQRKNADNEALRQEIEMLRQKKSRLEASSRHIVRMESIRSLRNITTESTKQLDDECNMEMEVEIAELREKIVEQEEKHRRQKLEITKISTEKEELKQELQEREVELKEIENQLAASKIASLKKMAQKDETITFMQNEMMKIMQEKQAFDKKMREQSLKLTEAQLTQRKVDDEAEMERFEVVNLQLRKLDEENRQLEEALKETKYENSVQLKQKQSIILDLQEELRDLKWELGAREKGADYITLLRDRKENKKELVNTRKELQVSQEKAVELELQLNEVLSNQKDLESEIESLNRSMDSEEHISGLKRQIKSLKQHNIALERKLDCEVREYKDKLGEKEARVRVLEFEMKKERSPVQPSIRGVLTAIPRFGRRNGESDESETDRTLVSDRSSPKADNSKRCLEPVKESPEKEDLSKKPPGGGNIWSLFSPRKDTGKTEKKNVRLSLSTWDASTRDDVRVSPNCSCDDEPVGADEQRIKEVSPE